MQHLFYLYIFHEKSFKKCIVSFWPLWMNTRHLFYSFYYFIYTFREKLFQFLKKKKDALFYMYKIEQQL